MNWDMIHETLFTQTLPSSFNRFFESQAPGASKQSCLEQRYFRSKQLRTTLLQNDLPWNALLHVSSGRSLAVHYCHKAHVWRERSSHRRLVTLVTWAAIGGLADLRLFDTFRDSRFLLTNDNPEGVGWPAYLAVFCVSSSFCGSQSKRYSRANGRNRKRWERGRGENGSPHPHRFLFRPCADVRLLAKHTKKTPAMQTRGEREPRK